MLPKNNTREKLLSRYLHVHPGPYHPHFEMKLPQFTELPPYDINEILGLNLDEYQKNKDDYTIVYESNPDANPPEFEGVKREYDESMTIPDHWKTKTHTSPKYNLFLNKALHRSAKKRSKYKQYK